jgi:hypothetical protein
MTRKSSTTSTASPHARKKRMVTAATVLPLAIGLASTQLPSGSGAPAGPPVSGTGHMVMACTLPFNAIEQHHPIDDSCGPDGLGAPNSSQAAQNDAKNNFCASGTPVDVDFDVLHQMQDVAAKRVTFGGDNSLPQDRSLLRSIPTTKGNIGEGTIARLAAFVQDAHYSNVGKGESVNCKKGDAESNDIHIVLQEKLPAPKANECDSATAEMSPHFRPDLWNPDILNEKDQNLFGGKKHLLRFTGQLFFDASHSPCVNGSGRPPLRSTIWEIHPVYNVEICVDGDTCTVGDDKGWQSLVEFANHGSTETRLRRRKGGAPVAQTAFTLRSWLQKSW